MTMIYQWHLQGEEQLTVKDLPLKSELKIGGITWILFNRNVAHMPSGAQTLVSKFVIEPEITFGNTVNYDDSNLQSRMIEIYDLFSEKEKNYILQTTRKYLDMNDLYPIFNEYVFPLTSVEVGGNTDENMGSNLGFNSQADRTCSDIYGEDQSWWLCDTYSSERVYSCFYDGLVLEIYPDRLAFVRPACNLSPDTPVKLGDDGYYVLDVPVPVLISFSIANAPFQAEEGMTWEQWVNSDYNTDTMYAYHINNGLVEGTEQRFTVRVMDNRTATQAKATDVIVNNGVYYHLY